MPANTKQKYYAVSVGRDGPMIYNTWDECKEKVSRFPHAEFKSFISQELAEEWLRARSILSDVESANASREPFKDPEPPHPEPASDATTCSPPQDVKLSQRQERVLEHVKAGNSVFFTGSAGTGKSVLLRAIISHFGGTNSGHLAITASTGIASVNIGGCTLHSWAGIGLGKQTVEQYAGKFRSEKFGQVRQRWESVKTLIIDESWFSLSASIQQY
ncbi:hypothetical protein M378DRAFT_155465 [Amanita muscaria Koide BX008]|uniref:ATP-dependent DNA helicase n=1 Tax=Amanita muscaria (strain Koide BX008) TaxID=946122 RepID=A0A0C2XBQ2_AMAMK|nr:hypothetical protein M378DRAFT_155465 [Amanita muscaria Koide BX008]